MADWIDELPEDIRETVRKNTENLVPKDSGEWVPANKINEINNKNKAKVEELEGFKTKYEELLETSKTDKTTMEEYKTKYEKLQSNTEYEKKLRAAGAQYPELFLDKEEKDIEKLKEQYPLYFKTNTTNSQQSGEGKKKDPTPAELRQEEIKTLRAKQFKTPGDYARIFTLMNKKD